MADASKSVFQPDALKQLFHDLGVQKDKIHAASSPLREQRDKLVESHRQEEAAINQQIKAAEAGLFNIDVERGKIAKFLQAGKPGVSDTGVPPGTPAAPVTPAAST